jgi:hypothetical protein
LVYVSPGQWGRGKTRDAAIDAAIRAAFALVAAHGYDDFTLTDDCFIEDPYNVVPVSIPPPPPPPPPPPGFGGMMMGMGGGLPPSLLPPPPSGMPPTFSGSIAPSAGVLEEARRTAEVKTRATRDDLNKELLRNAECKCTLVCIILSFRVSTHYSMFVSSSTVVRGKKITRNHRFS